MTKLKKLQVQRKKALEEAAKIVDLAESEDRDMTAEEVESYDDFILAADSLESRVLRQKKIEESLNINDAIEIPEAEAVSGGVPVIMQDPNRGFGGMGEFAIKVAEVYSNNQIDDRLQKMAAATGMSQASGPDGGYVVPPTFSSDIYEGLMGGSESLLSQVDSYTVTGESLTFPGNAETSRATGSRWGGVRSYWLAEASQMTTSKPAFRQIKVEPQQLAVMVYATDKLLKNSTAMGQYISRAATDEISFMVGDSILNGDGAGKPKGILTSGATVSVAKETSQAAKTIVAANINKMWARLAPRSWNNAVWLMNQDCLPQLDGVNIVTTDVGGTATAGGFDAKLYDSAKMTLKGRPIIPIEYCPTLGDAGDIILADMKGYVAGLRGGVESAMSIHLRFDYNETVFRFIFEVDGQTWLSSAITPFKGSSTLSHFVKLAARA